MTATSRIWTIAIFSAACASGNIGCVNMTTQLADLGDFEMASYGEETSPQQNYTSEEGEMSRDTGIILEPVAVERETVEVANVEPIELAAIRRTAAPIEPVVMEVEKPAIPRLPDEVIVKTGPSESTVKMKAAAPRSFTVRTTAYTHLEADSLQYGLKTARGDNLKFGQIRSAAADWSRYPVGTRFKIKGMPYEYIVDDYGSALVGTDTIDLYKPDHEMMNEWGARHVGIEVLEWGSFRHSQEILKGRVDKVDKPHLRVMLDQIEQKMQILPLELQDGFSV